MRGIEQFLQVDAATLGALKYAGTWNASTNTPTLASGVGVQGQYYVVSVAGSTNLDGETAWQVGDWAVFNGSVWQKVDGGSTGLLTTLTVTGNTYLATTSGDVGIGTSSPAAKLDVVGSLGIRVNEDGAGTKVIQIRSNYAGLGPSVQVSTADPLLFLTSNAERMRITSAGDVGIGTSSPTNTLTVAGNANITGNTTLGDASTDTVQVNGYMGVGSAATTSSGILISSSALTGANQFGVYSLPTVTSAATNNSAAVRTLISTAAASFTASNLYGVLVSNANKGAGSTITNQHGINIDDQTQGTNNYGITSLVSSGSNKWNIYASGTAQNYFAGNVGIGTNSLSQELTVQSGAGTESDVRVQGNAGASGYLDVFHSSAGTGLWSSSTQPMQFGVNAVERLRLSTTEAVFNESGADIDFRVESDTDTHALFVEGSSGNVGIGTSSPLSRLTIEQGGDVFTSGFTLSRVGADRGTIFLNASNNTLNFGRSTATSMSLNSSGNVGIGTTSPRALLDLNATRQVKVYFGTAGTVGETQGTASDYIANNLFVSGESAGTMTYTKTTGDFGNAILQDYSRGITFYSGVTGNTSTTGTLNNFERMRIDTSGNLGLGVTPSAWGSSFKALDIGSQAGVSAQGALIAVASNVYVNPSAQSIYKTSTSAGKYEINGNSHAWFNAPSGTAGTAISFTQAMTLDASGNLAVGTTSPAGYRLRLNSTDRALYATTAGATAALPAMYLSDSTHSVDGVFTPESGQLRFGSFTSHPVVFIAGNTERARIPSAGGMVVGTAALATTATDGFLYVPTCAGTPTGTPTTQTGTAPIVIDTTNNKLYFYSGGQWRDAGP